MSAVLLVIVVIAAVWWIRGAEVRRVNEACDAWLEHRGSLRTVVLETEEAAERAQADQAKRTAPDHFNNFELVLDWLGSWETASPEIREDLGDGSEDDRLERAMAFALGEVDHKLTTLRELMESEKPRIVLLYVPEVRATFQSVDDTCLSAARK